VVDASGKTVTPGFFDAHPHMDRSGLHKRGGIPLDARDSIAADPQCRPRGGGPHARGAVNVTMPMGTDPLG